MKFFPRQKVRIKNKYEQYVDGIVIEEMHDLGDMVNTYWWVQYKEDETSEVSIFKEEDLVSWNLFGLNPPCSCGSDKVNHPGHAWYCGKN